MADKVLTSPNGDQEQQFPHLASQASLCNLTFDEVQSQLGNTGKPLYNMSLDELLRHVISADSDQLMQNPSAPSPASHFSGNINLMNRTLSKKTVDEVWKEIVNHGQLNTMENHMVQRHVNLGETTLDEFLIRAGLMSIGNQDSSQVDGRPIMGLDPKVVPPQTDWLPFQMAVYQQQQNVTGANSDYNVSESVYDQCSALDMAYSANQLAMSMSMATASSASSDCKAANERKRQHSEEIMKKNMERRQRRMIKNRESAARSRAKKQAYTNQLEHKVSRLRKTNNWLKKQKEVEELLSSNPTPTQKYQLRRTSSANLSTSKLKLGRDNGNKKPVT